MSQLLANERSLIATRQHWATVGPAIALTVLVAVLGVVVIHWVPSTISGHDIGSARTGIRVAIVVVAVFAVAVRYMQWRMASYMLTDRRIVVSRGVVSRVTESITLDRVQNVTIRQGLGERMIGAGNLDIESAGRDGIEVLHRIAHPQEFYNELMQAIETHRTVQIGPGGAVTAPAADSI